MKAKQPRLHVSVNMVMTLDGKATTPDYEPARFSSALDKRVLVEFRAQADALMAGAGTVRVENMAMSLSDPDLQKARRAVGQSPEPLRVIISGSLRSLQPELRVFKRRDAPLVIFCAEAAPKNRRKMFGSLCDLHVCGRESVDFGKAFQILHDDYGVRRLHGEGGPMLNSALLDADLVDELDLTLAPCFFGGAAAPTIVEGGRGRALMADALRMKLVTCEQRGQEIFLRYVRK
ncbi:MAG: RibD family protein [Verrucomicrobiae bacterium]|nr:RibD family protein [Verrucomicrobiae bacterium]